MYSVLADFCTEPFPSVGADILPEDLSLPGHVLPELSSSSLCGGYGTGGWLLGPEFFASVVLEEPLGKVA